MRSPSFALPALFAVLTFAVAIRTLLYERDVQPPQSDSLHYKAPVIAFELADSTKEIKTLFWDPKSHQPAHHFIGKMTYLTKLDYLFIIMYTLFTALFAWQVRRMKHTSLYTIAVGIAIAVGLFDILENGQLLAILDYASRNIWTGFESELYRLHIFTWIKWEASGLLMLLLVPFFWQGGYFSKVLGILAVGVALLGIVALLAQTPSISERFTGLVMLTLLIMIVYTILRAILERNRPLPSWF